MSDETRGGGVRVNFKRSLADMSLSFFFFFPVAFPGLAVYCQLTHEQSMSLECHECHCMKYSKSYDQFMFSNISPNNSE